MDTFKEWHIKKHGEYINKSDERSLQFRMINFVEDLSEYIEEKIKSIEYERDEYAARALISEAGLKRGQAHWDKEMERLMTVHNHVLKRSIKDKLLGKWRITK